LAKLNEDYELVHCGRADWVIKIRDMRVDPLHVEAVLSTCDGVEECAVCPGDVRGEPALIAWYVGGGENIIHTALSKHLPEYMIPSVFVRIEKLPRNINGKIDRKALTYNGENQSKSGGASFTDEEKNIARLFAEVLNMDIAEFGSDDSFFNLGGSSLKLMDLQVRLNTKFKCGASYLDLLKSPTVHGITELINRESTHEIIPRAPMMDLYPLSPQMRQMWLLWRTGQDKGRYTLNTSARIKGDFDIERAEEAFRQIVTQNRILRAYFVEKDRDVFVRLADTAEVALREKPPMAFDLSKPPLYVISYSGNVLTFSVHHSLADAYSMRLITESFWRLYNGEMPIQSDVDALDIAVYERLGKQLDTDFWSAFFADGVPELKLPYDYPRSRKPSEVKEICVLPAKDKTLTLLQKKYGVTAYVLCLAAFGAALADICHTDDVVIGVPFSGRNNPDTLDTVGMLVNTLPVMISVGNKKFSEIVELTNWRLSDVFLKQDTSTEALSNYLRKNGSLKHAGLFSVSVNTRHKPIIVDCVNDLDITVLQGGYGSAVFDLILDVRDGDEVVLCYAKELFREETIVKIAEAIKKYIFIQEGNSYVEKQRKRRTQISMEASI
jgi:acyl carrier protein